LFSKIDSRKEESYFVHATSSLDINFVITICDFKFS